MPTTHERIHPCPICNHDERAQIENAILNMTTSVPPGDIDALAVEFGVSATALRNHALWHTPLVTEGDLAEVSRYQTKLAELDQTELAPACACTPVGGFEYEQLQLASGECPTDEFPGETAARAVVNSPAERGAAPVSAGATATATANGHAEQRPSLARGMKLREADMLMTVANEYLVTLKTMGRRINRMTQVSSLDAEEEDRQLKVARLLTKPMVELYIGLGNEIRHTVKATAELDRMLNGQEQNTANTGLQALAAAIALSTSPGGAAPAGSSGDPRHDNDNDNEFPLET